MPLCHYVMKMDDDLKVSQFGRCHHAMQNLFSHDHDMCSQFSLFVALKHICIELGLASKKNCRLIADDYGVHTLNDLLRLESRLESGELGSMVEVIKQKLLVAAVWRRKNPGVVVSEHFCDDVWDDWLELNVSLLITSELNSFAC